ncbi:DUF6175 family protein [Chitinivibrio alkaliphilus]|uniref:Uncharacterized protein n=1 Tax=Chitinivibrio alkaliphilus ACht1 TaxID=1313304 RepID=U7D8M9_9BACT|nr:DUF6175 family protein [Chitinivibrio alkaliphilus]ERP31921.1 hypothetical protein CALK_1139 [Chitinivibrio alkaliphilus ACht1]
MKKNAIISIVCVLGLYISLSASNLPLSKQASFVENYSSSEVTVQATGMGRRDRHALVDLRKAAVHFVLYGGTDPLLSSPEAQLKFQEIEESFFEDSNVASYITWEADRVISSADTRLPDGGRGVSITKNVRVHRQQLYEYLVSQDIILSRQDLVEQIGLPMIMVLPEVPQGQTPLEVFDKNPLARQAAGAIESHLTAQRYDVVVPRAQEQLSDLATVQGALQGSDEDISYQLALSLGADVYIVFSGEVENDRATVVLRAYETTTARLLGTETGYSERRPGASQQALTEEAVNSALSNVLSRVQNYWRDDIERGLQYKIIFQFQDGFDEYDKEDVQFAIMDAMEDMFTRFNENIVADNTMDYLVWATKDEYSRASSIYRDFRNTLRDYARVTRITLNRKFIVMGIEPLQF